MSTSGMVMYHPGLDDLMVDIDSVRQHPDNYNMGDTDAIAESIEISGMYRPLYVQESTGFIIAGNHSWAACKQLGASVVPVVLLNVDDNTAKRIMVADNRIASKAIADPALLLTLLDELATTDSLLGTGYAGHDLEVLRHLAEIPLEFSPDHAQWEMLSVRLPPHVLDAYR